MNFNLKQLEAFVWVSDLGSFRKAADRLNTTQPNISSRISGLESALKVTLMERDAGSVRLTSKGQELLKHARTVIQNSESLLEAAGNNVLFDGTLRLGVTELIVHTWLRKFLRELKEAYPNIVVELTVDLSVNLTSELFSRSIDLVFQNGPFESHTTGSRDLGTYPWIWAASPLLEIDAECSLAPEKLLEFPVLTHARDTKPFADVESHFAEVCPAQVRLVPSSNMATCLHMTIDGMGVAALPKAMVERELANGELVTINYPWVPEPMSFLARYEIGKSPKIVELAAKLAAETADEFLVG
ncbi:MAG: LysR family transcriptional regulator [Rhizobiaceae bacterium]